MSRSAPEYGSVSHTLGTDVATTPEWDFRGSRGSIVHVPALSSITSLTYHVAPEPNVSGTFLPLQVADGSEAVTQTVEAGKAYDMPAALFGAGCVKIVANAAGAVTISFKG